MKIIKLQIENYRLLKNFSMDICEDLTLVVGKNNTGKTSILSVLDKFLNEKSRFTYDDLNIDFKNDLELMVKSNNPLKEFSSIGIKLKIHIEYSEQDDLSNVSKVMMDLDPDNNRIVLGFEYTLSYTELLRLQSAYRAFATNETAKVEAGQKNKPKELKEFLRDEFNRYFAIHKRSYFYDKEIENVDEKNFIELKDEVLSIKDIVSYKHISARRDVTNKEKESTLSKQTSNLYKKKESSSQESIAAEKFKEQLLETDNTLSEIYREMFDDVINSVRRFGGLRMDDTEISIISTLQHRDLLEGNTTVIYSHDEHKLPEHYIGLGYMNLISMIFEIEILVHEFKRKIDEKPADINLLFIEEPEAHTHPQMQYVFIKNIKKLLERGVTREDGLNKPLQYIITTHSSHIVADCDFDDIKYLRVNAKNDVIAKNLSDLKVQYDKDTNQYQFLKQYLTISRAEVFFADKAVLIEGDTERILLPTFMRKLDLDIKAKQEVDDGDTSLPLLSQNISIIEVGAYSQIFEKFIDFLGIKCLILTDIDAVKPSKEKDKKSACRVTEGTGTSNSAIKHFLKDVTWNDLKTLTNEKRTIDVGSSEIFICYQQEEDSYHARSFEDAFIHINRVFVNEKKEQFQGLQNITLFDDNEKDAYDLASCCIKKKTHFALDILFHSDEKFSNWNIPEYIKKGLLWLKQD